MKKKIEVLVSNRAALITRIESFKIYVLNFQQRVIDKTITNYNISELKLRVDSITPLVTQFDDIQHQIQEVCENINEHLDEITKFEESYYSSIAIAKTILEQNANVGQLQSIPMPIRESQLSNIKLPQIKLPTFEGCYEGWLEFRDTFQSLIHDNNTIGDIQKFHYLRAALGGNAAQVVHSIEFSAGNYEIAWQLLCNRYDNNRLLVHNHVKSLFNIKHITKESSSELRTLIDDTLKHLRSLKSLGQPTDSWDTLVIFILHDKIDNTTLRKWEEHKINGEFPTLTEFITFLKNRADLLETLEVSNTATVSNSDKGHYVKRPNKQFNTFYTANNPCVICNDAKHHIYNCPKFTALSINDRIEQAKKLHLCFNCLRAGHIPSSCTFSNCKRCNRKHNTLLHFEQTRDSSLNEVPTSNTLTITNSFLNNTQVLLPTVLILVKDRKGNNHSCRALLDSGSESHFMSRSLFDKLQLSKTEIRCSVRGINQISSSINYKTKTVIKSRINSFTAEISCLIVPSISGNIPNFYVSKSKLKIPQNLQLADPYFNELRPVDLLIGADLFWKLACVGQRSVSKNGPTLQKTLFGWVISGSTFTLSKNTLESTINCNLAFETNEFNSMQRQLQRFWEIEEISEQRDLSREERDCESHFHDTVQRDENGRFLVTIPFKESLNKLGDSVVFATKRFYGLERRLSANPILKELYIKFMREYSNLGHMSKISDGHHTTKKCYYMPHHGVLKEDSLTSKIRVVFDGSANTSTGVSINDLQMTGPVLQQDLISIILRFRSHQFAVASDIAKMYRQVQVIQQQRCLQRIIWRENPSEPLDTYELNTVTYGTTAASYLAIKCLSVLSTQNQSQYPEASRAIREDFYVDDLLTGFDKLEDAKLICSQVKDILSGAGFELRKWVSNCPELLKTFQMSEPLTVLDLGSHENTKTLGLHWSCSRDELVYNIQLNLSSNIITKRTILSTVAQIFDPLGLVSPCTVLAKILLQGLWLLKLSWDESVPISIHSQWLTLRDNLQQLNTINIPRHVMLCDYITIELHGFSDSSEKAYGCCIYIRTTDSHGNVCVRLLCAKTKVAPLKFVTIPRLELCRALSLAQLVHKVKHSMRVNFHQQFLRCDSTIVLSWIKTPSNLLKTFVANRVNQIQNLTHTEYWHHVGTHDNPADLLSRGLSPEHLKNCKLWWNGPPWLAFDNSEWPHFTDFLNDDEVPEKRQIESCFATALEFTLFSKFSRLCKLQRVFAYCLRFKNNTKRTRPERQFGPLAIHELNESLLKLIKIAQGDSFSNEIILIKQSRLKGVLLSLNPFLDEMGLIRVGGRLVQSHFEFNKKHPILLPSKHPLTILIFRDEHRRLLHAGPQMLLSSIRERYWPLAGRNLSKKVVRECTTCFRVSPRTVEPLMGNLPSTRLQPKPPFDLTGVDFAGPFMIKDRLGRGCKVTKCYISLFICFVTKAIHLELVSALSTPSFIATLRRFISRRGKPSKIYSDNGTNFVGCNNELKSLSLFLMQNQHHLQESCAGHGIDWQFIPSHSPHFGGLWEAGVKSTKSHLKRVLGCAILTFEDFYTVLTQIEAVLNSRPLYPMSPDPSDLDVLTPSHFLIGRKITNLPESNVLEIPESRLLRFQRLQAMTQHFWKRWCKEYISELQQRTKWKRNNQQLLQIGTMVIIKDDNLPPLKWRLGRVIKLHPGQDNIIRVVSIRTSSGHIMRQCVTKVCVLPVEGEVI